MLNPVCDRPGGKSIFIYFCLEVLCLPAAGGPAPGGWSIRAGDAGMRQPLVVIPSQAGIPLAVIPAQAGIQWLIRYIPAQAGMTTH